MLVFLVTNFSNSIKLQLHRTFKIWNKYKTKIRISHFYFSPLHLQPAHVLKLVDKPP